MIGIMNLIENVYSLFNGFKDDKCRAYNGYNPDWRPNWDQEIESQWKLIVKNSPIPLPDDYRDLFYAFGGGGIEDKRPKWVIPTMTFWKWEDIDDFAETTDFFDDCPRALPFGDDIGDRIYLIICNGTEHGIYMTSKSMFWDETFRRKIADSFTELFTDREVQRRFRNYYNYGDDKGGDGR